MSRVRFLAVTDTRSSQAVSSFLKGQFSDSSDNATRLPTLLAPLVFVLSLPVLLLGCDAQNQSDTTSIAETTATNSISTPQALDAASDSVNSAVDSSPTAAVAGAAYAKPHSDAAAEAELSQTVPPSTRDHPVQIDWTKLDTKVAPVSVDTFHYPLAIDSAPVKAFADFAKVTPKQAQHTLTVSTASNEAVVKLIDQLGDSYVSHKVTDDGGKLIVYTTPNVVASHFDYVLADDFARGLVLPIEIQPQPQ